MEKEFRNYLLLSKAKDKPLVTLITDEDGNEIGFSVSGHATTYNERNENGGIFKPGDFDKFVREYFKKNKINMVCPIEHAWDGFDNRGVFSVVETDNEFLTVTADFYKDCCSLYEVIKGQVNRGILQGFSTYGWIMDDGSASLMNISLVSMFADKNGKLFANTKFIGFQNETIPEPEPTPEPKKFIHI